MMEVLYTLLFIWSLTLIVIGPPMAILYFSTKEKQTND